MTREGDGKLVNIAVEQAQAGDIVGAKETLGSITDVHLLRWAWITILEKRMQSGDLEGVKKIIASFPDDSLWAGSWVWDLVLTLANAGDFAGAVDIVNRLTEPSPRGFFLGKIASVQAQNGDYQGFEQTLAMLFKSDPGRDVALAMVAVALAKKGEGARAYQTAAQIEEVIFREDVLGGIQLNPARG